MRNTKIDLEIVEKNYALAPTGNYRRGIGDDHRRVFDDLGRVLIQDGSPLVGNFVVWAKDIIPALIAEVKRLRSELEEKEHE